MKTAEELEAMTKAQLDTYGNETHGIDLDSRRKKSDMIADILKAQEPVDDDPAPANPLTMFVAVQDQPDGVDLVVKRKRNGLPYYARLHLPDNTPTEIPLWALPTLEATNIAFIVELPA